MAIEICEGSSQKLGVTQEGYLTHFSLFSKNATQVILQLYHLSTEKLFFETPLKRTENIWHITLKNLPSSFDYNYCCDGPHTPEKGDLYNSASKLIDPYAIHSQSSIYRGKTFWLGKRLSPFNPYGRDNPLRNACEEFFKRSFQQSQAPWYFFGSRWKNPLPQKFGSQCYRANADSRVWWKADQHEKP